MRSAKPINEALLRTLARLGSNDADLAAICDLSVSSLRRRFGKELTRIRAERRTQINKMVWESAKGGNAMLLAWLGKTELGWDEEKRDAFAAPPRKKPFDFHAFAIEFERSFGPHAAEPDEPK